MIGPLLVALFEGKSHVEIFRLSEDPMDLLGKQGGILEIPCGYKSGQATDEHILLECESQIITL